jgi:lysophospholipid acyltransferase
LFTYLFIYFFGRKYSAFYLIVFNIAHLAYLHLKLFLYNYGDWSLGVETLYMMIICKFSTIAFNYEDGGKDEAELKLDYFKSKRLLEKPTLLEIFSFIFFYPSCLIGPSFEFKDYMDFIKEEGEFDNIPYTRCNIEFLKEFLIASVCMTIFGILDPIFDIDFAGTKAFGDRSIFYKIIYVYITMVALRAKYYSGWKLSAAALNLCGFNYQKKADDFNRIEVNISKIELTINPKTKIEYWNRTVHLWLKYYVFMRLIDIKIKPLYRNKTLAKFITFVISAFWHGFYLSYYVFFIQFFLIEHCAAVFEEKFGVFTYMEKARGPLFALFVFSTISLYSFFGINFGLLRLESMYNFNKSFYFVPDIFILALFVISFFIKIDRKRKQN